MVAFVAAKATGIESMADVVGMGAPIDLHFGKDIGLINLLHLGDSFLDCVSLNLVNLWILL